MAVSRDKSALGLAALVLAIVVTGACTSNAADPSDGEQNGDETDVDCGGSTSPPCADGKNCKVAKDCQSAACTGGTCAAPSPTDGVKNGDETDVDCGGTKAPKCEADKACLKAEDCATGGCSYAQKCVAPSCTGHFGGDTCGEGETGSPGGKHESCCATVTNSRGLRIGKYLITAGRMRAFIERYGGKLQEWVTTEQPKGWDQSMNERLPATQDDADFMLGWNMKRGCSITRAGLGGRTYWMPPNTENDEERNDLPKDTLDEKALNCVPWELAQALCVYDGGRLPTHDEVQAIMTNDGENEWPWQFQDPAPHEKKEEVDGAPAVDDRLAHRRNYKTPNAPANMRKHPRNSNWFLDQSYYVAPPGRFPKAANKIGVQDAVGNILQWVIDGDRRFSWTLSWEEHDKESEDIERWPPPRTGKPDEINGYYAIGGRCVFDQ